MTITVTPTDADFEAACSRRYADGKAAWAALKREATKAAAVRLLDENEAWRKRIAERAKDARHAAYIALDEEREQASRQWKELLDLAYPSSAPQPPHCDHKFVGSNRCLKCGWAPA